ncbi:hypothetical protein BZA77DRAFT_324904 [Pyronema omphalodes]|nr:hypothetical protein BZA77DRAFT_324904 [Pyronema omphalodes]
MPPVLPKPPSFQDPSILELPMYICISSPSLGYVLGYVLGCVLGLAVLNMACLSCLSLSCLSLSFHFYRSMLPVLPAFCVACGVCASLSYTSMNICIRSQDPKISIAPSP